MAFLSTQIVSLLCNLMTGRTPYVHFTAITNEMSLSLLASV